MRAEELVSDGIVTVNVLLDVLSEPKSKTQIAGFVPPTLYINAPLAVIDPVHAGEEKFTNAILPFVVFAY
jgi:hypothetical protein